MALVIDVRLGEPVVIGDAIVIVMPHLHGNRQRARMIVDAPRSVEVTRIVDEITARGYSVAGPGLWRNVAGTTKTTRELVYEIRE